jgi:hypothetical protein
MKRRVAWVLAAILSGMTFAVIEWGEGGFSSNDMTGSQNFRLLVSDDVNAIGDVSENQVAVQRDHPTGLGRWNYACFQ